MPADHKHRDDPQETADYLLKKHGQHEAYAVAVKGAIDAQEAGDNYRLSVWRDVKRLLATEQSISEKVPLDEQE
ncbi:MAG: hypothetical protein HOE62_01495 [Alphaproteobacteria bacterium]|jgi:hypothetical protein|nr:hypothetical protein [Alphaproteobacteria bacterium]